MDGEHDIGKPSYDARALETKWLLMPHTRTKRATNELMEPEIEWHAYVTIDENKLDEQNWMQKQKILDTNTIYSP